ncbi:hypothetical protein CLOLEP_02302 [[Clostridium] leptum DSM 753]|uniref:Uncharacterized protein n=1 Tax=[Clostridium] leptum DSM 753 TaxID=428125 RepID=A7VUQ5_9FIRM|nr:hypothetical protein CLOLEP_02302 [[Clostridium] leptum DSM 753]
MSFPYADRPMWLYSRSSDKHLKVLFQQMQNLLDEAERRAYAVAGYGFRQEHGQNGPEADDAGRERRPRPSCPCAEPHPPKP